jgi:hypothetical protein
MVSSNNRIAYGSGKFNATLNFWTGKPRIHSAGGCRNVARLPVTFINISMVHLSGSGSERFDCNQW